MKRVIAVATLALPFALLGCRTNDGEPKVATTASAPAAQTTAAEPAPAAAPEPVAAAQTPAAPVEDDLTKAVRVSVPELQQRLAAGNTIIVDVRPADAYAESHILGAINIPLGDLPTRMGELPKNKFIATYCT